MEKRTTPREAGFENGLKVLWEGYNYIPNRLRIYQSDIFETRLLGRRTVCMGGEEAARLFYDETKIKRKGAASNVALKTLLGPDSVFTLDDEEHRNRKQTFLDVMSEEQIEDWKETLRKHFLQSAYDWSKQPLIIFYEEVKLVLTKAVCEWAGVPLPEEEVEKRMHQLADILEIIVRPKYKAPKALKSRKEGNAWGEELVQRVREGELHPAEHTALYQFAFQKNLDGTLIDKRSAATDLMSILRPSVAIAIFISFVALTLHQHPEIKAKLQKEDSDSLYYEAFVQEVRRYYPFIPCNAGRAREDFTWQGYEIEKDTLVVFDFYGTCFDERIWENPETFNPERFLDWETNPSDQVQYKLVAQGGGDYLEGHRCPGEWNTVEAMKVTAEILVKNMIYDIPSQDLGYSMSQIPMMPKSGIVMANVRLR